jgi:hypothetical protein
MNASLKKSAHQIPIEFSSQHEHGERFAHAGPDKLLGIRIENDLVRAAEDRQRRPPS